MLDSHQRHVGRTPLEPNSSCLDPFPSPPYHSSRLLVTLAGTFVSCPSNVLWILYASILSCLRSFNFRVIVKGSICRSPIYSLAIARLRDQAWTVKISSFILLCRWSYVIHHNRQVCILNDAGAVEAWDQDGCNIIAAGLDFSLYHYAACLARAVRRTNRLKL